MALTLMITLNFGGLYSLDKVRSCYCFPPSTSRSSLLNIPWTRFIAGLDMSSRMFSHLSINPTVVCVFQVVSFFPSPDFHDRYHPDKNESITLERRKGGRSPSWWMMKQKLPPKKRKIIYSTTLFHHLKTLVLTVLDVKRAAPAVNLNEMASHL